LFAALPAELAGAGFDLIVCNPPYIPSGKLAKSQLAWHEPREAFDGGPFGLNVIIRLIEESPAHLKPGSWLCFEIGVGQSPLVTGLLEGSQRYGEIRALLNQSGQVRALAARTAAAANPEK